MCRRSGAFFFVRRAQPNWPEREPSEFHMRPGERNADDAYSQHDRCDEVTERQPPTGEN